VPWVVLLCALCHLMFSWALEACWLVPGGIAIPKLVLYCIVLYCIIKQPQLQATS
jgi:hypothetical protein